MPQKQSADSKQRSASPSSPTLDIVGRLRTATGLDLDLKREAADEITRLRITDAEREAVRFCAEFSRMGAREDLAATLRGLLERTK